MDADRTPAVTSPSWIAGWLKCVSCGRWFHPKAKTCGNYCKDAR